MNRKRPVTFFSSLLRIFRGAASVRARFAMVMGISGSQAQRRLVEEVQSREVELRDLNTKLAARVQEQTEALRGHGVLHADAPHAQVLDLVRAAAALQNDHDLLAKVLGRFREDFAQAPDQIRQALEQRQFDVAARLVHSIKGIAPLLGADALHRVAQQFEPALMNKDPRLQGDFDAALRQVLAAIPPPPDTAVMGESGPAATIDTAILLPLLKSLAALLQSGQTRARQESRDIESMLDGTVHRAPYAPIARAVARFDFVAASDLLNAWAREQNWDLQ